MLLVHTGSNFLELICIIPCWTELAFSVSKVQDFCQKKIYSYHLISFRLSLWYMACVKNDEKFEYAVFNIIWPMSPYASAIIRIHGWLNSITHYVAHCHFGKAVESLEQNLQLSKPSPWRGALNQYCVKEAAIQLYYLCCATVFYCASDRLCTWLLRFMLGSE